MILKRKIIPLDFGAKKKHQIGAKFYVFGAITLKVNLFDRLFDSYSYFLIIK